MREADGPLVRLLPLLPLTLALGCGSPPPLARPPPARVPATIPPAPWPRFAEVAAWPALGGSFTNQGHWGAGALAVVRVSPGARAAYEVLVTDTTLPESTIVALFHSDASGRPGRVFVMEKGVGSWSYVELTPTGLVVPTAGGACRSCHQGGTGDSLFGLPRPTRSALPP
jgi:hypothetical protein